MHKDANTFPIFRLNIHQSISIFHLWQCNERVNSIVIFQQLSVRLQWFGHWQRRHFLHRAGQSPGGTGEGTYVCTTAYDTTQVKLDIKFIVIIVYIWYELPVFDQYISYINAIWSTFFGSFDLMKKTIMFHFDNIGWTLLIKLFCYFP